MTFALALPAVAIAREHSHDQGTVPSVITPCGQSARCFPLHMTPTRGELLCHTPYTDRCPPKHIPSIDLFFGTRDESAHRLAGAPVSSRYAEWSYAASPFVDSKVGPYIASPTVALAVMLSGILGHGVPSLHLHST